MKTRPLKALIHPLPLTVDHDARSTLTSQPIPLAFTQCPKPDKPSYLTANSPRVNDANHVIPVFMKMPPFIKLNQLSALITSFSGKTRVLKF